MLSTSIRDNITILEEPVTLIISLISMVIFLISKSMINKICIHYNSIFIIMNVLDGNVSTKIDSVSNAIWIDSSPINRIRKGKPALVIGYLHSSGRLPTNRRHWSLGSGKRQTTNQPVAQISVGRADCQVM